MQEAGAPKTVDAESAIDNLVNAIRELQTAGEITLIVDEEEDENEQEYDEEEDGLDKIDDQAVEIMSPGKKIKAFEKEEKKIITEPSIDVLQPVEREEIIA